MTGVETQMVRTVAEQGRADAASVARRMGVSAEYITPRIRSLVEDGYLRAVGDGMYAVKQKGTKALFPYAGRGTGRAMPVSSYP
jgi:predicted transcriptional regulator